MKKEKIVAAVEMGAVMLLVFSTGIFGWPSVYPKGTTIYKPDKCCNGYTLKWERNKVSLIDMNGRITHKWTTPADKIPDGIQRARLLENGNILVQKGLGASTTGGLEEYDWDGKMVWRYIPQGKSPHKELLGPHHDVFRKPNGNTLLICREAMPVECMKKITEHSLKDATVIYPDVILEVTPDNEILWEWHGYKYLNVNEMPGWQGGQYKTTKYDWMHTNTVQALPKNKWYDKGDKRFKPGNVMISCRHLDTLYIVDRDTKKIVWSYTGDYVGGLSGQHDSHMIEKGIPGEGNIIIFDNGASPRKDFVAGHANRSYAIEINPTTKQVVWKYENKHFHSSYTSSVQRLQNGNTLICEQDGNRIFEVTKNGEIVWEYINGGARAYRYPYDLCPQTVDLGKPKEVSVTPPEDYRIPADAPLE